MLVFVLVDAAVEQLHPASQVNRLIENVGQFVVCRDDSSNANNRNHGEQRRRARLIAVRPVETLSSGVAAGARELEGEARYRGPPGKSCRFQASSYGFGANRSTLSSCVAPPL